MQPLNPFLAAFFKSPLPSQCTPVHHHVLLVPTTEVLLTFRDAEGPGGGGGGGGGTSSGGGPPSSGGGAGGWDGYGWTQPQLTDEFLASHVLRIPTPAGGAGPGGSVGGAGQGKDAGASQAGTVQNLREVRGKAKQYNTINGRSVVIKDAFVYSNKGFKSLAQSQLLNDAIFYPDSLEPRQWLIYYISRPLVGTWEEVKITPAIFVEGMGKAATANGSKTPPARSSAGESSSGPSHGGPRKRDIKNFHELLNHFPGVARQMQPGLEKLFGEFRKAFERPLPPPPSASSIPDPEPDGPIVAAMKKAQASGGSGNSSAKNVAVSSQTSTAGLTNGVKDDEEDADVGPPRVTENFYAEEDEDTMRASMETAVTAAIDLFQAVDKHQLSLLGANTELTGPVVERLLERYVADNVHHLLWPRLCAAKRPEDLELEAKIRQMEFIDISQLGIALGGRAREKHELMLQLGLAVDVFRKMTAATSPQEMMELLLNTMKTVTQLTGSGASNDAGPPSEKSVITVNADTLVSLLLYVIIRAQIRNLLARLVYMRHFIFVEDVDSGELGYALSTFEAVLAYLSRDSGGLRRASRRNKALWDAVAKGNMDELRKITEPSGSVFEDDDDDDDEDDDEDDDDHDEMASPMSGRRSSGSGWSFTNGSSSRRSSTAFTAGSESYSQGSGLGHVFPFQNNDVRDAADDGDSMLPLRKVVKKVAMDTRSMSSGSEISYHSRAASVGTISSGLEGDTSVERLCRTQDSFGESVPMMAIQNERPEALNYLLSLEDYFPVEAILEDINNEDTTLLSAAVQLGHLELIDILLDFVLRKAHPDQVTAYFARQDIWGRSLAHYLFHAPSLIPRVAALVPWRQRDKNGQTPLFALCRSYDHADYHSMVEAGLAAATAAQADGQPLHLDDHVDGRGNTLLHIVNDASIALRVLHRCDVDVNAVNDKRFTALMLASKYGRFDMVRALFADARVDTAARELRGLTAVELAKDDDVRNKIDDLALFAMPSPASTTSSTSPLLSPEPSALSGGVAAASSSSSSSSPSESSSSTGAAAAASGLSQLDAGRITGVVRSFFVEDATIRLVLKSGAPVPGDPNSYTVTTCRRSLTDFEHLASLLAMEEPASWIPAVTGLRSPFQLPSKPSRAVLKDVQVRMDWFLRIMLAHPTFCAHEMLWEFFLAPEIQPDMMEQRSRLKAEARAEKVRDEMEPLDDVREVEQFVDHARDTVRSINYSTKSVARKTNVVATVASDLYEASVLLTHTLSTLPFLSRPYIAAFDGYVRTLTPASASPHAQLHATFIAAQSTIAALLAALARPPVLIGQIAAARRNADRSAIQAARGLPPPSSPNAPAAGAAGSVKATSSSSGGGGAWAVVAGLLAGTSSQSHTHAPAPPITPTASSDDSASMVATSSSFSPSAAFSSRAQRLQEERDERARRARRDAEDLGRELRYTQQVVAGELAGWQEMHARLGRAALREFARAVLVQERMRLEGMRRVMRRLKEQGGLEGWGEKPRKPKKEPIKAGAARARRTGSTRSPALQRSGSDGRIVAHPNGGPNPTTQADDVVIAASAVDHAQPLAPASSAASPPPSTLAPPPEEAPPPQLWRNGAPPQGVSASRRGGEGVGVGGREGGAGRVTDADATRNHREDVAHRVDDDDDGALASISNGEFGPR